MTAGRAGPALAAAIALGAAAAQPTAAQLASPCEAACAVTLGVTGVAAATGATVAWGRVSGGISRGREAYAVWGTSFALFAGGGLALGGDGGRQRRAVYASGLGALAGTLVGLAAGPLLANDDPGPARRARGDPTGDARTFAAALIGAAGGALLGGVYGALTHDGSGGEGVPLFAVSVRF